MWVVSAFNVSFVRINFTNEILYINEYSFCSAVEFKTKYVDYRGKLFSKRRMEKKLIFIQK